MRTTSCTPMAFAAAAPLGRSALSSAAGRPAGLPAAVPAHPGAARRLPRPRPRRFATARLDASSSVGRGVPLAGPPEAAGNKEEQDEGVHDDDAAADRRDAAALVGAIAAVAVGKRGVKPVPLGDVQAVEHALRRAHGLAASVAARAKAAREQKQQHGASPTNVDDTPQTAPDALSNLQRDILLQRASLLGSLFVKADLAPHEMQLLQVAVCPETKRGAAVGRVRTIDGESCSAGQVLAYITMHKMHGEQDLAALTLQAIKLLGDEPFSVERAKTLGSLLYKTENNSITAMQLKALVAHVMRIRHESEDELVGLAEAAADTLDPAFRNPSAPAPLSTEMPVPVLFTALLAEPFDGVLTWDLLTPLLARHLRTRYGMGVVLSTGTSSGPKFGPNLQDVARAIGVPFVNCAGDLIAHLEPGGGSSEFGVATDQQDCSPALHAWVPIRRAILKRPALATVEKFVDPVPGGATIFISSAFHPSYVDKMAGVAEARRYPGYIIVSKGVEGSIGLGFGQAKLVVGTRSAHGKYTRTEIVAPPNLVDESSDVVIPMKGSATCERAVDRIRSYVQHDSSGDKCYDLRLQATLTAFDSAMAVLLGAEIGRSCGP